MPRDWLRRNEGGRNNGEPASHAEHPATSDEEEVEATRQIELTPAGVAPEHEEMVAEAPAPSYEQHEYVEEVGSPEPAGEYEAAFEEQPQYLPPSEPAEPQYPPAYAPANAATYGAPLAPPSEAAHAPGEVLYVPLAVTVGDGFKFGCGFFLASVLVLLGGFVLLAAQFALDTFLGVNLPLGR